MQASFKTAEEKTLASSEKLGAQITGFPRKPETVQYSFSLGHLHECLYRRNDVHAIDVEEIRKVASKSPEQEEATSPTTTTTTAVSQTRCEVCQEKRNGECPIHGPLHSLRKLVNADRRPIHDIKPTYAVTSFPEEVQLCTSGILNAGLGVCAKQPIPIGTWIGPYEGKRLLPEDITSDTDTSFLWEIYDNNKLLYYLDACDENTSSWMRFIRCARYREEQNLFVFQYCGNIYYRAFKDITIGSELLVWYDEQYLLHFGIPLQIKDMATVGIEAIQSTHPRRGDIAPAEPKEPDPATASAPYVQDVRFSNSNLGVVTRTLLHPESTPLQSLETLKAPRERDIEMTSAVPVSHVQSYHRQHVHAPMNPSVKQILPSYESTVGNTTKVETPAVYNHIHNYQVNQKYDQMQGQAIYASKPKQIVVVKEKESVSAPVTKLDVTEHVTKVASDFHRAPSDDRMMDCAPPRDGFVSNPDSHLKPDLFINQDLYRSDQNPVSFKRRSRRPDGKSYCDYPPKHDFNRNQDFPINTPAFSQKPVYTVKPNRIEVPDYKKNDAQVHSVIMSNNSNISDTIATHSITKLKPENNILVNQYGVEQTPLYMQVKHPLKDENQNIPNPEDIVREFSPSQGFHEPSYKPGYPAFPSPPESGSKTDMINSDMDYQDMEEDFDQQSHSSDECMRSPEDEDGDLTLWKCGQCGKTFTQRALLQVHICPRCPDKPYHCGHCSQSFSQPNELRTHVVTHTHERPFKCGYCARSFAGATTLNNHIRTHTGEKPFCCEKCGKSFTQASQLSRHQRMIGDCIG